MKGSAGQGITGPTRAVVGVTRNQEYKAMDVTRESDEVLAIMEI